MCSNHSIQSALLFFLNEDMAIYILNSQLDSNVSVEVKGKYIELLSTVIKDISKVEETILWKKLFGESLVLPTSNNILYYFNKYGLDQLVTDDLNKVEIDFTSLEKDFDNETIGKFFYEITTSNSIDIEKYKEIVNNSNNIDDYFDGIEGINEDKIEVLVNDGLLSMTDVTFRYIFEYYKNLLLPFIKQDFTGFLNLLSNEEFSLDDYLSYDEILEILIWDNILDDDKIKLLVHIDVLVDWVSQYPTNSIHKRSCIIGMASSPFSQLLLNDWLPFLPLAICQVMSIWWIFHDIFITFSFDLDSIFPHFNLFFNPLRLQSSSSVRRDTVKVVNFLPTVLNLLTSEINVKSLFNHFLDYHTRLGLDSEIFADVDSILKNHRFHGMIKMR